MATKINQSVYGTVPTTQYSVIACPKTVLDLYNDGNFDPSGNCEGGFEKSISPWGIGGGMCGDWFTINAQRSANGRYARLRMDTMESFNKPISFWNASLDISPYASKKTTRNRIAGNCFKATNQNIESNGSTELGLTLIGINRVNSPYGKLEYNNSCAHPYYVSITRNETASDGKLIPRGAFTIEQIDSFGDDWFEDSFEMAAFTWGLSMYNSRQGAPNQWESTNIAPVPTKASKAGEMYKALALEDSNNPDTFYDDIIVSAPNVCGAYDDIGSRLGYPRSCYVSNDYIKLISNKFTNTTHADYCSDGAGRLFGVGNGNKHVFDDISYHYEIRFFVELNGNFTEVSEGELILSGQQLWILPYYKIDDTTYSSKWESIKAIIRHELAFIGFPFAMSVSKRGFIGSNDVSVPIFDDHLITTGRYYTGAAGATLPNSQWGDIFSDTMPEYDPDYIPPKPSPGEDESDRGDLTNQTPTRRTTAGTVKYVCSFADISNLQNFLNGSYSPSEVQWIEDFKGTNPADYIVSIQKYPFTLPSVGNPEIVIGSVATSINAKSLFSSSLSINQSTIYDFGGIELTGELLYGDFRDYLCKLTLIMPFIGSIDLDPRMYMGHRVDLQYIIDFDTGSVAAEIKRDGLTMETKTSTISITIPFFAANMGAYQNALAQTQFAIEQSKIKQIAGIMSTSISIGGTLATGASGGALSDTASLGAAGGLVGGIASMLSGQVQQQQLQYELEHTAPQIGSVSVAAPANAFFLDDRARLIITRPCMIPGYNAEVYSHTVGNACAIPGTLSSFSGYTIASAAELSSITARDGSGVSPTAEELRMIKQALQAGIYV